MKELNKPVAQKYVGINWIQILQEKGKIIRGYKKLHYKELKSE